LKNNISFGGTGVVIDSGNSTDHNTFAGPGGTPAGLGVSAADFVSTVDPVFTPGNYHPAGTGGDRSGITTPVHATGPAIAPRLSDGGLPFLDFLTLAPGSHLIDVGVDVGLPFNGLAPDIGWLETVPPTVLPGDYNDDHIVDAGDYTVWRNNLNSAADLPNDETPGMVDESDYDVWKLHFGASLAGSGSRVSNAVPEPASVLLSFPAVSALCLRRCRRRVECQ
jgi:hypothetical protein